MKVMAKLIRSLWLLALALSVCFGWAESASGTVLAIAYDGQTQPRLVYDAP
jgi:hypothetical protein